MTAPHKHLNVVKNSSDDIALALLPGLYSFVQNLLLLLKTSDNIHTIEEIFDVLQCIQELLSDLIFNRHIDVSVELRKFVRDFERLDESWLRDFLLAKIKEGAYSLYDNA